MNEIKTKLKSTVSGRSMIEMLGVLAIVGVLSIGGLYGLRSAQDKYRANSIINDVMLAAADLLPRAEVLPTQQNISNFSFTPKNKQNISAQKCADGNIEIMVTNVPQKVCERVLNNGVIKGTQGVGIANKEMNSTFCDGMDLKGSCYENTTSDLVFVLGDTRELCGGTYCESGYFCLYDDPTTCDATSCTPTTGTCTSTSTYLYTPRNLTVNGIVWGIYSYADMNWWSARSWCYAQGETPASTTDVDNTSGTVNAYGGGNWLPFQESSSSKGYLLYPNGHYESWPRKINIYYPLCKKTSP